MKDQGNIAVLGAGAWGTALACAAARAGNTVTLFGRDRQVISEISQHSRNSKYLPDVMLDFAPGKSINVTDELTEAIGESEIILLAIPAQQISAIAGQLVDILPDNSSLVCCAKGIDRQLGKLPAEILQDLVVKKKPNIGIAALSGPSFATDVAGGLPTAVTVASNSIALSDQLVSRLSSPRFRCYASSDLKGVELGGALKNVIAIAVGAVRGMQLGASAEAALIARGFAEMNRIAISLGAQASTLTGLSGLGDLVLTCSHTQSRNFSYGMALGTGESLEGRPLAEGAFTAAIAASIARDNKIEAPIIMAVSQVLDRTITAREAVEKLLERPLRKEIDTAPNSGETK